MTVDVPVAGFGPVGAALTAMLGERGVSVLAVDLWLIASYSAPCPRRCSGTSDRPTRSRTGPSAHSTASANSKRASAVRVRQS